MADTIPPTGLKILDQDLKRLLEFGEAPDLQERLSRVTDPRLSVDEIVSIVPLSALRLAKGLLEIDEDGYRQMRNGISTEAQPFLDRARQFAIDELAPVVRHPSVQALIEDVANQLTGTGPRISAATRLNVITGVSHAVFFIRDQDQFVPSVRVFVDAHDNKQLIDSTLELDDVAFLASGLVQALKSGLAQTKAIDGPSRLTLSDESNRRLCKGIRELLGECSAVEELAREFGLDLSAPDGDADTGAQDKDV